MKNFDKDKNFSKVRSKQVSYFATNFIVCVFDYYEYLEINKKKIVSQNTEKNF